MDQQVERWRAETPGCGSRNHLNSAGASLMPAPVVEAMVGHLRLEAEIGGYEAADSREREIADGYDALGQLLGTQPRNIAVVGNATAGFVQAVSTIDFAAGDTIVTSRCDYTSNQIQYLALRDRLGVRVRHAEDLPEGGVDPDSVRACIVEANRSGRCRLVSISWIPTNSGLGQFDFGAKRVDSAVRLSPHYFNTEDEIDQAVEAVREFLSTRTRAKDAAGGSRDRAVRFAGQPEVEG